MSPHFTQDWFDVHIPLWNHLLEPLRGRPVQVLEIGVFEGRSTLWLLENLLTHPEAGLTYIDTFEGSNEMAGMDLSGLEGRFLRNTLGHHHKLFGMKGPSTRELRRLPLERFDFVYVDGSHLARDVLSDAVLSWPLLKAGGLLAFDDYAWDAFPEAHLCPRLAIDAFLGVQKGTYEEVHRGYQVWVKKRS